MPQVGQDFAGGLTLAAATARYAAVASAARASHGDQPSGGDPLRASGEQPAAFRPPAKRRALDHQPTSCTMAATPKTAAPSASQNAGAQVGSVA